MQRVPVWAVIAWVLATGAAAVVAWVGVGAVTSAVSASPEPVIPSARIASDVRPSPGAPQGVGAPLVTVPASPRASTTTTHATSVPATSTAVPGAHAPSTTAPSTTNGGNSLPSSTVPAGASGPTSTQTSTTTPATSTTTSVPAAPVTYTSPGGQATVTCSGNTITLSSALPDDGYQLNVLDGGPQGVTVSFSTGTPPPYQISAVCEAGLPQRVTGSGGFPPTTTTTTLPSSPPA